MEDLGLYLKSETKDYQTGLALLEKYQTDKNKIAFFKKQSKPQPMHLNMMLKALSNIYRINGQRTKSKPNVAEPAIKIDLTPIRIERKHFSEVDASKPEPKLDQSKLLTNKLLARQWNELDKKEQDYFVSQNIFEHKKNLMLENGAIENELKSIHARLEQASVSERGEMAEKLVSLKKQQAENWAMIDNFVSVPVVEKSEKTEKAELILKRNNLRSLISKLQKVDKTAKNYEKKMVQLENVKTELEEINKLLG